MTRPEIYVKARLSNPTFNKYRLEAVLIICAMDNPLSAAMTITWETLPHFGPAAHVITSWYDAMCCFVVAGVSIPSSLLLLLEFGRASFVSFLYSTYNEISECCAIMDEQVTNSKQSIPSVNPMFAKIHGNVNID